MLVGIVVLLDTLVGVGAVHLPHQGSDEAKTSANDGVAEDGLSEGPCARPPESPEKHNNEGNNDDITIRPLLQIMLNDSKDNKSERTKTGERRKWWTSKNQKKLRTVGHGGHAALSDAGRAGGGAKDGGDHLEWKRV